MRPTAMSIARRFIVSTKKLLEAASARHELQKIESNFAVDRNTLAVRDTTMYYVRYVVFAGGSSSGTSTYYDLLLLAPRRRRSCSNINRAGVARGGKTRGCCLSERPLSNERGGTSLGLLILLQQESRPDEWR